MNNYKNTIIALDNHIREGEWRLFSRDLVALLPMDFLRTGITVDMNIKVCIFIYTNIIIHITL